MKPLLNHRISSEVYRGKEKQAKTIDIEQKNIRFYPETCKNETQRKLKIVGFEQDFASLTWIKKEQRERGVAWREREEFRRGETAVAEWVNAVEKFTYEVFLFQVFTTFHLGPLMGAGLAPIHI